MLNSLDFPLAAPSANPFGYVSPTTATHVNDQLGDSIGYILDGGPCDVGIESTIIGFAGPEPEMLRLGGLDPDELRKILGPVAENLTQNSNPAAPGQLDKHYSPKTRFELIELGSEYPESVGVGFLRFNKPLENVPIINQFFLASDGDLHTAAKNLFHLLRKLDGMKFSKIVAERVPDHGLGRAINDRLRRAAAGGISPE
jgi:L-threonylcarbamoyladenylate synthase